MSRIGISYLLGDFTDAKGRIFQQFLRFLHPDTVQQIIKRNPEMLVQQLGQIPLAYVTVIP